VAANEGDFEAIWTMLFSFVNLWGMGVVFYQGILETTIILEKFLCVRDSSGRPKGVSAGRKRSGPTDSPTL